MHGHARRGQKHHLYQTWLSLRQRCNNPKKKEYCRYGGRGIKVDPRWNSFTNFLQDMEPSWQHGLSINRINNDGPYSPSNCEWATQVEQCNNTRQNRHLTYNGETLNLCQWAKRLGVSEVLILDRLDKLGWSVDRALITPAREMHIIHYEHNGQRLTLREWSALVGIDLQTLRNRLSALKWTFEQAITTPKRGTP